MFEEIIDSKQYKAEFNEEDIRNLLNEHFINFYGEF